jgi:hypothetical protein
LSVVTADETLDLSSSSSVRLRYPRVTDSEAQSSKMEKKDDLYNSSTIVFNRLYLSTYGTKGCRLLKGLMTLSLRLLFHSRTYSTRIFKHLHSRLTGP